ncbi:hypothetical protein C0991_007063 [Blastosporella zonata]|nr:hypothetical protein C0991_007063 [Blastosporella zonata]
MSMTKLANVLWMRELQKQVDAVGAAITCMSINPGKVNTFASRMPFPLIASILFAIFFEVSEVGAYTSCFAAASPAVRASPQKYKGTFLEPVGVITEPSDNAKNEELAKELWDTTESVLTSVGGKSDGGIDLLGWWWLPQLDASHINAPRRRLRVLAQCKAEKKKIGPKFVRELEGVLHRYLTLSPSSHSFDPRNSDIPTISEAKPQYPLVAIFISESPFTRSTLLRAQSSPVPLFLLHLPPVPLRSNSLSDGDNDNQDEWVGSAVWNPALAGVRGLLGGEFEICWERSLTGCGRPGLWWHNQKLNNWNPEMDGSIQIEDLHLTHEDLLLEELAEETA